MQRSIYDTTTNICEGNAIKLSFLPPLPLLNKEGKLHSNKGRSYSPFLRGWG
jgi:hypothetical protein